MANKERDGGMRDAAGADRGASGNRSDSSRSGDTRSEAVKDSRASKQNAAQTAADRSKASSGAKTKTEVYKDPDLGGLVTGYGAPVHTVMDGPAAGTQVARDRENWSNLNDRVKDYNSARREFENRTLFDKIVDFVSGPLYNENAPDFNDPDTFHGGTFHTSTNPAGVAGMIAGSVAGPLLGGPVGGGLLGGQIGSELGPEAYHNPATEQQQRDYNFTGQHGLDSIASSAHQAPSSPTGGDRTGQGGTAFTGGLVTAAPSAPSNTGAAQAPAAVQPTTPAQTATPDIPSPYPKPEEIWGSIGQNGNYVFDEGSGMVRFVPG